QEPTPVRRDRRRVRLGVALESEALTAVVVRRTLTGARPARIYNRSIEPPGQGSAWPALTDALGELREFVGGREATLHVALLRPLSHVKTLHLPPLRSRQLQMLLEQNAARFFPVRAGAAYNAHLRARREQRAHSRAFAAVAEAALVEAVVAAAEQAGFRVHGITAGPTAVVAG